MNPVNVQQSLLHYFRNIGKQLLLEKICWWFFIIIQVQFLGLYFVCSSFGEIPDIVMTCAASFMVMTSSFHLISFMAFLNDSLGLFLGLFFFPCSLFFLCYLPLVYLNSDNQFQTTCSLLYWSTMSWVGNVDVVIIASLLWHQFFV